MRSNAFSTTDGGTSGWSQYANNFDRIGDINKAGKNQFGFNFLSNNGQDTNRIYHTIVPFQVDDNGTITSGSASTIENSSGSLDANGILANGTSNNIRYEVNGLNKRKGTFNLVIRQGNDTTKRKQILETWNNVSMDPNAKNFIARVIGDQKVKLSLDVDDENEKRLIREGTFPNKSDRIRVVMSQDVLRNEVPDEALPFGFGGIPALKKKRLASDSGLPQGCTTALGPPPSIEALLVASIKAGSVA